MSGSSTEPSAPPSIRERTGISQSTPRSSWSQANSNYELVRQVSKGETCSSAITARLSSHDHWCTICENPIRISTCDGWKRHEKEKHESGYLCMPDGPIEHTTAGPLCAFCNDFDPKPEHLTAHSIHQCLHKPPNDRRYTRKSQLEKHLKSHGILDAATLADKWKVSSNKKYYSCGFCIAIFITSAERLNHIDNYHYKRLQTIEEWDPNKVIRGLLLQPDVYKSWKTISAWDIWTTNMTWEPSLRRNLQKRLELSEESPENLAATAAIQGSLELVEENYHDPGLSIGTAFKNGVSLFKSKEVSAHSLTPSMVEAGALGKYDTVMDLDCDIHPPQVLPDIDTGATYDFGTSMLQPIDTGSAFSPFHINFNRENTHATPPQNTVIEVHDMAALAHRITSESWEASSNTQMHGSSTVTPYTAQPVLAASHTITLPGANTATVSLQNHHMPSPPLNPTTQLRQRKKSPSFITQIKRRFSHVKTKDGLEDIPMDFDLDDLMRRMEDDQDSRTKIDTRHEVRIWVWLCIIRH